MKGKILVVDDDNNLREIYCKYLTYHGFKVKEARDGIEAVRNCTIEEFDLVLMDVIMPGLNGIDAIKALQIIYPNLEIWIVSGHASDEQFKEAKRLGIKQIYQKPVNFDIFVNNINKFLESKDK